METKTENITLQQFQDNAEEYRLKSLGYAESDAGIEYRFNIIDDDGTFIGSVPVQ